MYEFITTMYLRSRKRGNILHSSFYDHEEGDNAFDGERCAEDVTHEPGVVGPVRAELELQDDTRGDTHREVDAEELLPKLRGIASEVDVGSDVNLALIEGQLCLIILGLDDAHDDSQPERQGHEEPMVDCREGKLRP